MELTNKSVRKHQINDEGLAEILRLKENNSSKPAINSVSNKNFEFKFWFSRWELLHVKNGVLCYRWMENNCEKLKICTPKSLRDVVLWHIHDSETSGHLGIRRTYAKLMANCYYWPHMRRYVQDYVSSCDICEERKNPSRRKRAYMKRYLAGEKFERIAIDITGPFPKSENGHLYILVVADYFSKFMQIFPLPNLEAETVAEVIFKGWIKRYGCPGEIHTDQGSQFECVKCYK